MGPEGGASDLASDPYPPVMGSDRSTLAVRTGMPHGPGSPLAPPIHTATARCETGEPGPDGWHYSRDGHPGLDPFEEAIASLDGGVGAVSYTSGIAAAGALLDDAGPGTKVLMVHDGYFGIRRLAATDLVARGVELELVDGSDVAAVAAALPGASMLWLETPTNPLLRVHDLEALARVAADAGVPWVIDATVPTPILLRPLELGAAAVLHSATKGISGHSDVLIGAVSSRDPEMVSRLCARRSMRGTTPSGFSCWLARRGMQTLDVRVRRSTATALALAERLAAHPEVVTVHHAGLPDHPDHEIARRIMPEGVGGLFSFEVADAAAADRVVDRLALWSPATSFGGAESTLERRSRWTAERGPKGLLRCWAGLESVDDLWVDLRSALDAERAEQAA